MIELNNVSKSYNFEKKEIPILKEINIRIKKGETVGIVGKSGAGKSTLIRLINGLIKPTSGYVLIDGIDIGLENKKTINEIRKNIGMVFQHFNLLSSLTVYENIKLALRIAKFDRSEENERIIEVLKAVSLLQKKDSYPKDLSGGEKQRVGIARAIVNKPEYLLCDEITSALDNQTAYEIIDTLNEIKEKHNLTIIFISHQLDMVRRFCDRVIVMNEGVVVEDNDILTIFKNPRNDYTKQLIHTFVYQNKYYLDDDIYKLTYDYNVINLPIIANVVNHFKVNIDIVDAEVIKIKNQKIGILITKFKHDNKDNIIEYLLKSGVEVRRLKEEF